MGSWRADLIHASLEKLGESSVEIGEVIKVPEHRPPDQAVGAESHGPSRACGEGFAAGVRSATSRRVAFPNDVGHPSW